MGTYININHYEKNFAIMDDRCVYGCFRNG